MACAASADLIEAGLGCGDFAGEFLALLFEGLAFGGGAGGVFGGEGEELLPVVKRRTGRGGVLGRGLGDGVFDLGDEGLLLAGDGEFVLESAVLALEGGKFVFDGFETRVGGEFDLSRAGDHIEDRRGGAAPGDLNGVFHDAVRQVGEGEFAFTGRKIDAGGAGDDGAIGVNGGGGDRRGGGDGGGGRD
jgi:hypothetical protein